MQLALWKHHPESQGARCLSALFDIFYRAARSPQTLQPRKKIYTRAQAQGAGDESIILIKNVLGNGLGEFLFLWTSFLVYDPARALILSDAIMCIVSSFSNMCAARFKCVAFV